MKAKFIDNQGNEGIVDLFDNSVPKIRRAVKHNGEHTVFHLIGYTEDNTPIYKEKVKRAKTEK